MNTEKPSVMDEDVSSADGQLVSVRVSQPARIISPSNNDISDQTTDSTETSVNRMETGVSRGNNQDSNNTSTAGNTQDISSYSNMGESEVSSHHIVDFGLPFTPPKKTRGLKMLAVVLAVLVIISGSASAFYFGYYMSPTQIWSNSLANTGKGYDKLITYANTQANTKYSGDKASASLSFKQGGTTYTGSLSEQNDANNSEASLKVDIGPANLELQALSVKQPAANAPDIYINLSGFKGLGLGNYLGVNEQQLDSLDGQWISIDHTLLDQIEKSIAPQSQSSTSPKLSWAQIYTTAQDIGRVNSQYIFTANPTTSVTQVVKQYGFETVDGHKTYHYKVGFVKANVKNYITALKNALEQSPGGQWAAKESGESVSQLMGYSSLESNANNINSSDTIDVWVDTNTRLIYKVRVSDPTNPTTNYVDIGLDYTKGNSYPFFINWLSNSNGDNTSASLVLTLNSSTHATTGFMTVKDSSSSITVTGNILVQPTNQTLNISAPANSISLQSAMTKLGLSGEYNALLQSLASGSGGSDTIPGTSNTSSSALDSVFQSL